VVSVSFLRGFP